MTNRKIVVDNATLSGVQRLTGSSRTLNLNYVDNDILCLEKLITAILFSDALIGIDDYKEKYRSDRLKQFSFIEFVRIDQDEYNSLQRQAAEFAREMVFSFEGAKPVGDVLSFFEALRSHPQLRWDVFGSSEYLTLSLLVRNRHDVHYEAAIESAFRNEVVDADSVESAEGISPTIAVDGHPEIQNVKDLVRAFGDGNSRFVSQAHNSLLNRLVFGYGWTAERSYFYNTFAAKEDADAFLAPLRDAFCESCCRLESRTQVENLLERLKSSSQTAFTKIIEPSGRAKFAMKLPFFTAYFISKVKNPLECIEMALETRNRSEFKDCRVIFHNMAHLSHSDRYREVNEILRYLEQSCELMLRKFGVSTEGGLQASVSLGVTGPSVSAGTKLNHLFRAYRNRPFARVFRNIAQDMLNVEKLGGLHDKLCSSLRMRKDARNLGIPATPRFMENKESEYGRPAKLDD